MTAHPGPANPSPQKKVPLRGSERHVRPSYQATGPAPPDQTIRVVIKLRPRQPLPDPAVLGDVLPTNRPAPAYDEHVAQFGATAEDVQAVVDFAKAHNLAVVESSAPMRMVVLSGTVKDMEAAFQTQLQTYHSAKLDHSYRGRTGPITIPEPLQPIITAVAGLDDRPQAKARAAAHKAPKKPKTTFYTPPQLAQLYAYPTNLDGTGQCIGLFEFGGGYQKSDLDAFFQKIGVATPSVTSVSVDGTTNSPGSDADGEVVLDIQVAGGAAPGAKIAVYFAQFTESGWVEAITKAIHDTTNKPSVISISWGWSELEDAGTLAWTSAVINEVNTTLAEAANLGITVLVAAGDDGSTDGITDGKVHVDYPSSSPNVLAVGGTTLLSTGGKITSEVVWSGGTRATGTGSTGGGVSEVFPKPSLAIGRGPDRAQVGLDGLRRPGRARCGRKCGREHGLPHDPQRPERDQRGHQRRHAALGRPDRPHQPAAGHAAGRQVGRIHQPGPLSAGRLNLGVPRHHQRQQRHRSLGERGLRGRAGVGRLLGLGQPRRREPPGRADRRRRARRGRGRRGGDRHGNPGDRRQRPGGDRELLARKRAGGGAREQPPADRDRPPAGPAARRRSGMSSSFGL